MAFRDHRDDRVIFGMPTNMICHQCLRWAWSQGTLGVFFSDGEKHNQPIWLQNAPQPLAVLRRPISRFMFVPLSCIYSVDFAWFGLIDCNGAMWSTVPCGDKRRTLWNRRHERSTIAKGRIRKSSMIGLLNTKNKKKSLTRASVDVNAAKKTTRHWITSSDIIWASK